jgi:UDP-N-acetylglucosamine:LPS N-acetylglucosamine transferase
MSAKKKILILSSYGGYGHMAAAKTITKLLSDSYDIEVAYPIKDLRLGGLRNCEAFYNYFLSRNCNRFTNWYVKNLGNPILKRKGKKIQRLIEAYVEEKQIDLVISLIPLVNEAVAAATYRMGVPFLLVTTDNDLVNWVPGLEKMKHHQFRATVGTDLPTTKGALLAKGIDEREIEIIGLPLRPEFFSPPKKEEMREAYSIPADKNVVLILMGGAGASLSLKYVKALAQSKDNLHLIVCCGRNHKLVNTLKAIPVGPGNTLEAVPFTEKIHELLALSDLLITKPGPGSINEAMACKIPMLIDQTNPTIYWEAANIDLVTSFRIGDCVRSIKEIPSMVHRFLFDEQLRESIARSYAALPENQFGKRLAPLIEEMTGETSLVEEVTEANV